MNQILNCDLCGADAGDDPYHATMNGNGHVHICAACFDPWQHDVAVLREKLNAAIKDAERWRLTFVKLQNPLESALKSNQKLLDQIQVLEMRLAVRSKIISDRSHAGGAVMSQWIKCSDRLPDFGRLVLVCDKPAGTVKAAVLYECDDDDGPACCWIVEAPSGDPEGFDFEYWMPLPPPPETQPHEAQRG